MIDFYEKNHDFYQPYAPPHAGATAIHHTMSVHCMLIVFISFSHFSAPWKGEPAVHTAVSEAGARGWQPEHFALLAGSLCSACAHTRRRYVHFGLNTTALQTILCENRYRSVPIRHTFQRRVAIRYRFATLVANRYRFD